MGAENPPGRPRGEGRVRFEVGLEGRADGVFLTKSEFATLMRVTDCPPRWEYILSPEYKALPKKVRLVVKNWLEGVRNE